MILFIFVTIGSILILRFIRKSNRRIARIFQKVDFIPLTLFVFGFSYLFFLLAFDYLGAIAISAGYFNAVDLLIIPIVFIKDIFTILFFIGNQNNFLKTGYFGINLNSDPIANFFVFSLKFIVLWLVLSFSLKRRNYRLLINALFVIFLFLFILTPNLLRIFGKYKYIPEQIKQVYNIGSAVEYKWYEIETKRLTAEWFRLGDEHPEHIYGDFWDMVNQEWQNRYSYQQLQEINAKFFALKELADERKIAECCAALPPVINAGLDSNNHLLWTTPVDRVKYFVIYSRGIIWPSIDKFLALVYADGSIKSDPLRQNIKIQAISIGGEENYENILDLGNLCEKSYNITYVTQDNKTMALNDGKFVENQFAEKCNFDGTIRR